MIPGKKYKPEHFLYALWRCKWVTVLPWALAIAGTWLWARSLPDEYRSEAVVLVVPQQVPENFVRSTISSRIDERLNSITQQILSRSRLEQIIVDFNLYPRHRQEGITDAVIQQMRQDIAIEITRSNARREDATSFRVSYTSYSPETAMQVTERLAGLLIAENLRERENQARSTSQFLETELEAARRRLMEHEQKLEAYRRRYAGELPSQLQSNLQVIQSTELQIQNLLELLNRDRDRRLALERMIADGRVVQPTEAPIVKGVPATFDQLVAAQSELAALELRLTQEHPDVLRMRRRIEDLRAKAATEAEGRTADSEAPVLPTVAELARRRELGELEAELEQVDRQISYKEAEEDRLRGSIAAYQRRVEAAPTRESELVTLTRDYDTLQQLYKNLLAKKEDSKISANLEDRQIGEQFRLIEAPQLPQTPDGPDRMRLVLFGSLYGLALGIALVAFLEYRDTTLKTDEDVLVALDLPVLAIIPRMTTAFDLGRLRRRKLLVSFATLVAVAACAAVLAWKFGS